MGYWPISLPDDDGSDGGDVFGELDFNSLFDKLDHGQ